MTIYGMIGDNTGNDRLEFELPRSAVIVSRSQKIKIIFIANTSVQLSYSATTKYIF